ncbi:MAG: translation initiation factor Sui1 [Deferrisomatales bacterium]
MGRESNPGADEAKGVSRKQRRRNEGPGWALVRECPRCGEPETRCCCPDASAAPAPGRPVFRIRLEKRGGKPVTVCSAQGIVPQELKALARRLQALCGTGGTVKGDDVELQGDRRELVRPALRRLGCRVKG